MQNKMDKEKIIDRITQERDYQDQLCTMNNMTLEPTVEGELLMLKHYVDKTINIWTKKQSNEETLNEIRKITAIGMRCLENHGCPKRDFAKGVFSNEL